MNVVLFQQDIVWENPEANYRKVETALSTLQGPVDIIVVPETFNTGFSDNMAAMAEQPEGDTYRFACRMARQYNSLFVGTWTVQQEGKVYNRLHWVRPDGTYGWYDKAHTFRMSSEASQLGRGTQRALFEWRGWKIKPAVCYDLRFPKWLRNGVPAAERYKLPHNDVERCAEPCALDYDLMIVCANWPGSRHEAWSTLLRARAIENLSYVVGVNRVGTDGVDIPYTGNCAAVDYKGQPLVECQPGQEQLQVVSLDYDALQQFRQHWPFYLDFD